MYAARPKSKSAAKQVQAGRARALIVNAGNSNAFTGYRGREAVEQIMAQVAEHLGCPTGEVFVSSTGVIGVPLPKDKARAGVAAALTAEPCGWEDAASTIGTTDTFPRARSAQAVVGGKTVNLAGIIKGSGMIAPDMATMLGYIFTDAAVEPASCSRCCPPPMRRPSTASPSIATPRPATRCSPSPPARPAMRRSPLSTAPAPMHLPPRCEDVCRQLAQLVVRDGEGAQKFIAIDRHRRGQRRERPHGSASPIANSPLVKTAIAGEDANWGRVVMAVGKAGEPADRDRLSIGFGGIWAAREGQPLADYDEAPVAEHLKGREIDDRGRSGPRRRPRHRVDLRPHPRLHLDQCRLPQLMEHALDGAVHARDARG